LMMKILNKFRLILMEGGAVSFSKRVTAKNKANSFRMRTRLFRWRT
jgi:hypothetical protein